MSGKRQDLPYQAPRTFSQTFPPNPQHQTDSLCKTDHQHQTDQGSQSHLSLTGGSVATADKCREPLKTYVVKKRDCVTLAQRFYKLCLDPDILQLCILNRADIRNDPADNSTRQFRKAAYRQFILDKYGYLGRGNRKVVPSCVVWKVHSRYPSPTGVYMGFRDS